MSDNIFEFDVHEAREMGWHKKTKVNPGLTVENCFLNTQEIIARGLFLENGEPAIAETDEEGNKSQWSILGYSDVEGLTVGSPFNPATFKPITNRELLDLVATSLKGTGHVLQSVLTCGNRSKVSLSINLAQLESYKVGNRVFEPYLNFLLGRDKAFPLTVKTGNTCVVCANTFNMALYNDKGELVNVRVKQTKKSRAAIANLPELIDGAIGVQAQFRLAMEQAEQVPLKHSEAKGLFLGHLVNADDSEIEAPDFSIPTKTLNRVDRLTDLFHDDSKGNEGRTLGDAFHAVTDFFSHESAGGEDTWKQVASSEFGSADRNRGAFFEVITSPELLASTKARGEKLLALC